MTSCSRRLGEGWVVTRLARKRSRSSERNQSTVPLSEPPTSTQGAMYRTGTRSSPPVIAAAPADTSTAHGALIDIHPELLETAQGIPTRLRSSWSAEDSGRVRARWL